MKRLIEKHPDGTEIWFETTGPDTYQIYSITNVDKTLDQNKRLQNEPAYSSRGVKRGMWHYATIPNDVLAAWHHKGIIDARYPLSPRETDGELHKLRRKMLESAKQWSLLKEMDKRQEMAARNKEAITRMLNNPDYAYLKTVRGRV